MDRSATPRDAEEENELGALGGIRAKVLSLVSLSALVPALLVGVASYLTAREILVQKISSQLSARASSIADRVTLWFDERANDARVFAGSFVVSENLAQWENARRRGNTARAREARLRIGDYIDEVQDRYPLYLALLVVDPTGDLLARAGRESEADDRAAAELVTASLERKVSVSERELLVYCLHPVSNDMGEPLGALVTVSDFTGVWRQMAEELSFETERARLVDAEGRPVLEGGADPRPHPGLVTGAEEIAEYRDDKGRTVLSAHRSLSAVPLTVRIETSGVQAFAAVTRLRRLILLICAAVAAFAVALGYGLVVSLLRPVDALIEGAQRVSRGDFSGEIPVRSRDEIGYLTLIFNRMTRALEKSHSRLEVMSSTDELTQLSNRRQLERVFSTELARAERTGTPVSLLMIDVDRFKEFNDQLGHLKGDDLLRELGSYLSHSLRAADVAVRYGGEEFLVILPSTDREQARELAERLREEFAHRSARIADEGATLSIGVATFPEDGGTQEELIQNADRALYEAKENGRNRVEVFAGEAGGDQRSSAP